MKHYSRIQLSGSLTSVGAIDAQSVTASFFAGDGTGLTNVTAVSASLSTTASYILLAQSSSHSTFAEQSKTAATASFISTTLINTTSSYAQTASYVHDGVVTVLDTYTSTPKITNIITLSQAEYDSITLPNSSVLYVVI